MIDSLRRIQRYRWAISAGVFAVALTGLFPASVRAQGSVQRLAASAAEGSASGYASEMPSSIPPAPIPAFAPQPGDVLTPNNRRNTPSIKIGLRAGINRSSYSNDRYLDNVPLDVGNVSGETDIYSSAAGFGYSIGTDVEYPLNQAISILGTLEYQHVTFGASGPVQEPCVHHDGTAGMGSSIHDFKATIDYITLAGSAKLTFSSWYLTAGFSAGHPLATTLDRTRRLGGTDCYYPDSGEKQVIEESGGIPNVQRIHYSFRLGGGIIYRLTDRLQFSPELTLDFGYNSINKSPNSDLGVYGISATVRYDLR